jgi:uncharacterized protein YndB with AHSA1/START domain
MIPQAAEHSVVRLERLIPAPPHRVYRAWLDPGLVGRWMAPGDFAVTRVEIDERAGGAYRVWQADADGSAGGFECDRPLNAKPKYVASTSLTQPLAWHNSTLIEGDIATAVTTLKRQPGADLYLIGSTELLRVLAGHDLVDEYQLMIDPIILGSGKRAFPDCGTPKPMQLTSSQVTTTGAIIASYSRP